MKVAVYFSNSQNMSHKQYESQTIEFLGRKKLLIYGYIRTIEHEMAILIPQDIKLLIIACYPNKLIIIGIGKNFAGQFGLGHHSTVDSLNTLPTFSSITHHSAHIYCGRNRYMIQSIHNNDLYSVGSNIYSECGLDYQLYGDPIVNFTKINHIIRDHITTISTGNNSQHTIIMTHDIDLERDRFYVVGSNNMGQLSFKKCVAINKLTENTILNSIFEKQDVIKITCGSLFSLFLTKQGRVFSCSDNRSLVFD